MSSLTSIQPNKNEPISYTLVNSPHLHHNPVQNSSQRPNKYELPEKDKRSTISNELYTMNGALLMVLIRCLP